MAMADYDLGTARGKVVVDYKDHGAKSAARSLDYLRNVGSRLTDQFKSLNSSMEGSRAGFLHVQSGAHGAEMAVKGLAQALALLDDTMNIVERRFIGFGKVLGNRLLDANRSAGTLAIALRGVPKELNWLPKEAKNFIRFTGAIGTAAFGVNLLRQRTDSLAKVMSVGGRVPIFESAVRKSAGAVEMMAGAIDGLRNKNIVFDKLAGGIKGLGSASLSASNRISGLALAVASAMSVAKSLNQLEKFQRQVSKWVGISFTAMGTAAATIQPVLSVTSTALLGVWDAAKQLSGVVNLLPAAIFSLGTPLIAAAVGFQGLGNAMSLAFSEGEKAEEALEEALKDLAPSAADLVRTVRDIAPAWKEVQKSVQDALFEGSADGLRRLSENYLPVAEDGLKAVAAGLNEVTSGFAEFANQPESIEAINEGLHLVSDMLGNVGDAFTPFLEGMREVGLIGTRYLEKYSRGLEGAASRFSEFVNSQAGAEKIGEWIEAGVTGFRDLGAATADLSKGIGNVLRPFAGGDFNNALKRLSQLMERFRNFTDPAAKGGKAIKSFADSLKRISKPWKQTFGTLFEQLGKVGEQLGSSFEKISARMAKGVELFIKVLGPMAQGLAKVFSVIGPELASMILGLTAARMALKGLKIGWQILKPIFALISGLQALTSAFGSLRGTMSAFGASFDKVERKARGNFLQRGMRDLTNQANFFGRAMGDSAQKSKNAINTINSAIRGLSFRGIADGSLVRGLNLVGEGFRDSAKYAKQANPQLRTFGVMGHVIRANMSQARDAIRGAGTTVKSTGAMFKSAGLSLLTFRDSARAAKVESENLSKASTTAAADTSKTMAQRIAAFNTGLDRLGRATVNAAEATRNAIPTFRDVGGAIRNAGSNAAGAAKYMAAFPSAMSQSMKYAKQAAPEMGTLSRAMRVLEANFGRAADQAKVFNKAAVTMGGVVSAGMTQSMGAAKSAAGGLLGVLGGPWGAALMGATVLGADFAMSMSSAAAAQDKLKKASIESASAQRDLRTAMAFSGGKTNEETQAAAQRMVQAELDKTSASANQNINIVNDLDSMIRRNTHSYEDWARQAENGANAMDRQAAVHEMAKQRQDALNDALEATGMSMDQAVEAFASGGPELDRLQAALTTTGGAGEAVIAQMSGVGAAVDSAAQSVADMGPKTAALGAALDVISDSASSAEDSLNAMVTALQALGLIDDSAFDEAQEVAENIAALSSAAAGSSVGADALGNDFFDAEGKMNAFNESARNTQDALVTLRDSILQADPSEMMALFEQAGPGLEKMRVDLGATAEEWDKIITQVGMTPETIEMAIAIKGMDGVQQSLLMAKSAIDEADGQVAGVTVEIKDERALDVLRDMGFQLKEIDGQEGKFRITAATEDAELNLNNAVDLVSQFNNEEASATLDADTAKVYAKTLEAKSWISSLDSATGMGILDADEAPARQAVQHTGSLIDGVNSMFGMGTLDANNDPAAASVGEAGSMIDSVNSMFGMGILDADNSAVGSKVAWAQATIDSLRGKTVFIDVIQRMTLAPLPAGAGTLDAFGATGGKFTGNSFNLRGYRSGGRHSGYRLPSRGPGTDIVDGFLALNHLGAPVARLDKDEWVINNKSSKKWNRLLAAINRDDPRLKYLPKFAEGGQMGNVRAQVGKVTSATQVVAAQLNLEVNASQVEAAAAMMGQISADEFAAKFGKGIHDGINLGSRDYFMEQGRQYSDQLGIVFGKAAQDANDRLQAEIDAIEDKNLKEQKRKLLKSTDELQDIADREMREWVNKNQFEVMGYTMAQSFAQGVSSGQNLVQAGIGALGQAATLALSAAGAPGIIAGLATTAIGGLASAFSDPSLWDDGMGAGLYKIVDSALAGLPTMLLDIGNNITKIFGLDLSKVPIIGGLFDIKDAANGTAEAVDQLLSDIEALNKLEYKNLGKTGATNIDAAIEASLGNRVLVGAGAPAGDSGPSGPSIEALNVYAPDDKASSIIEAATFEMKRY